MSIRPRRSVLYMPGSNARAMEKARELPADAVIFDLEDAVAPDAKATARTLIVQALQKGGFGNREVLVRINGLDTACWLDDLAVAAAGPDAVLVPKVSTPEQLRDVAKHLVGVRAEARVRVWAMMETPLAMLNARDIAAAALDPQTVPVGGFPTRALFFQPRLGAAYDLHGGGKTVLRGGWGRFYYHSGQFNKRPRRIRGCIQRQPVSQQLGRRFGLPHQSFYGIRFIYGE